MIRNVWLRTRIERLGRQFLFTHNTKLLHKTRQAGMSTPPYEVGGLLFVGSMLLAAIFALLLLTVRGGIDYLGLTVALVISPFLFFMLWFMLLMLSYIGFRLVIEVLIYRRVTSIERNLPSFLRSFSTNLRAGREFVQAMEDSNEPGYGALYQDLSRIAISIRGGAHLVKVLEDYVELYDSYIIQETFGIIKDAYIGGGGLADIIEKIADNLDVIDYLKKKAIASVSNYVLFMSIVALVISPLLFSLSQNLLRLVEILLGRVLEAGSNQFIPSAIQNIRIDYRDFLIFSQISIGIIAASTAGILSVMRNGNLKSSPVLILIYVSVALIIHQVALWLLTAFFNTLFQL